MIFCLIYRLNHILPLLMANKKDGGFCVDSCMPRLMVAVCHHDHSFESFRYTGLFLSNPSQTPITSNIVVTPGQRCCIFFLGALTHTLNYQIRRVSWNLLLISHLWIRTCENSFLPPILCQYSQYFVIALLSRVWDDEFFVSVHIAELVLRARDRVHGFQWFFPRLSSQSPACRRLRNIRGVYFRPDEPWRGKVGATGKICGVGHVFLFVIAADTLVEHLILQVSLFLSVLREGGTI